VEKVLSQEEIDAMIRAARGEADALGAGPEAKPWDARESGHLAQEQVRAISQPHEVFARNLTYSLGAHLRVGFGAALVSAEYLAFREFPGEPPGNYLSGSFQLAPVGAVAILHLDHTIAFPVIDLLLGARARARIRLAYHRHRGQHFGEREQMIAASSRRRGACCTSPLCSNVGSVWCRSKNCCPGGKRLWL